jgi:hypothetical protein
MAKSIKKAAKKTANKTVQKTSKKIAKKAAKKVVKKAVKKQPKKPAATTGKRFLIIYHAPIEAMAQTANISPEEQAAGMALWQAWAERCGLNLIDLGAPLMNGKSVNAKGDANPSKKEVTGYSLLQAEDWDELMDLLEGHPHISGWHPDATIEVHETMILPGM